MEEGDVKCGKDFRLRLIRRLNYFPGDRQDRTDALRSLSFSSEVSGMRCFEYLAFDKYLQ